MILGKERLVYSADNPQRPSITALSDGRLVIGMDAGGMKSVPVLEEQANGEFYLARRCRSVRGGGALDEFDASRLYVTSLASSGTSWVMTWRCGCAEWGRQYGPAACNAGRSIFLGGKPLGAARIAHDPKAGRFVVLSKDGNTVELAANLTVLQRGQIKVGGTGEKLAFAISANGIRHAALNGCKALPSQYLSSDMPRPVRWADYATYPDQGPDTSGYMGIGLAAPRKAVVAAIFGGRARANVFAKGVPVYSDNALLDLGPGSREDRCGISFAPLDGSLRAWWRYGSNVMSRDIKQAQAGTGAAETLFQGGMPAACWNKARASVAVAYCRAGSVWVREIKGG